MKSLHWSCRMRKRKFPMIMIRVASPHFLSAPSTRRTPLLWIFARWWKLSWKPPGRSRTTICPIRISTNSSLENKKYPPGHHGREGFVRLWRRYQPCTFRAVPGAWRSRLKSARADSEKFFTGRKFQKWRNTVCISRFWNCTDRGKEPLFSRRGFIQRFPSLTPERGAASNDFRKSF